MNHIETYRKVFMDVLGAKPDELETLKYRTYRKWDSVGHMELVTELENQFEIHFNTADVLDIYSYEKGIEVLEKYGVTFPE